MVSKIEAAERLAEAVERHRSFCEGDGTGSVAVSFNTLQDAWKAVGAALSAYRSASVPSDEDLGRVAYEGAYKSCAKWDDVPKEYGRLWTDAAAAVREWLQRDGLKDEEREAVVALVDCHLVNAELRASILRKLGREPVWEWDNANAMWTLGGKVDSQVFPCASVMLSSVGILARVYLSEKDSTSVYVDSFKEACEWCEQKIREARQ